MWSGSILKLTKPWITVGLPWIVSLYTSLSGEANSAFQSKSHPFFLCHQLQVWFEQVRNFGCKTVTCSYVFNGTGEFVYLKVKVIDACSFHLHKIQKWSRSISRDWCEGWSLYHDRQRLRAWRSGGSLCYFSLAFVLLLTKDNEMKIFSKAHI